MHCDASTSPETGAWWFMGAGPLAFALRSSGKPPYSPYGLLLWSPDQFVRTESTWLYHPENGLGGTMIAIDHGGGRHRPEHQSTQVEWIDPLATDSGLLIRWDAGGLPVTERFTPIPSGEKGYGGLRREIELQFPPSGEIPPEPVRGRIICGLLPNPLLFEGLPRTTSPDTLGMYRQGLPEDEGDADLPPVMEFAVIDPGTPPGLLFERFVQIEGEVVPGQGLRLVVEYRARDRRERIDAGVQRVTTHPDAAPGELPVRLAVQSARSIQGIRSVVDRAGRFDASVWQYGYEWGQDAAMVAMAAAYCGEHEIAWRILENTLDRLVDHDGRVAESSRFRGGDLAELNANGAVLSAAATCALLSGEGDRLRARIDVLRRLGELVVDASNGTDSGLIEGRRDLWERLPWMGVEEGADIATNSFVARGLLDISPILRSLGEEESADRWERRARELVETMFSEQTGRFIEDGHLIHRRLRGGDVAETMQGTTDYDDLRYRPYIPVGSTPGSPRRSVPDSVEALPILHDLLPSDSAVAGASLDRLDAELWDATGIGGYLRSPVESDPDSPGPWPFVTAWMAEAELRTGRLGRALRTTNWLLDRAGHAGSWHEYYGPLRSSPAPPVGIIVWGWAQYLLLCIRGWYGIELSGSSLRIAPRLDGYSFRTSVSGFELRVDVADSRAVPQLSGGESSVRPGSVEIPLPLRGPTTVTFR